MECIHILIANNITIFVDVLAEKVSLSSSSKMPSCNFQKRCILKYQHQHILFIQITIVCCAMRPLHLLFNHSVLEVSSLKPFSKSSDRPESVHVYCLCSNTFSFPSLIQFYSLAPHFLYHRPVLCEKVFCSSQICNAWKPTILWKDCGFSAIAIFHTLFHPKVGEISFERCYPLWGLLSPVGV